uniref:Uncharacterized protein n=1 Tax=Panthera leo TaxID=9689 RepID=A0A8C8X0J8_PANLE
SPSCTGGKLALEPFLPHPPNPSLTLPFSPKWLGKTGKELPWASQDRLLTTWIQLLADEVGGRIILGGW